MQDRPTAPELLDAMAAKLFAEVREWVPRERRFQVLVLANLCAVIARELRAGRRALARRRAAVPRAAAAAGRAGDRAARRPTRPRAPPRPSSRGAIRAGELDDRLDEAIGRLREHVAPQARDRSPGVRRLSRAVGA